MSIGRFIRGRDDGSRGPQHEVAAGLYAAFMEEAGRATFGTALNALDSAQAILNAAPDVQAAVLVEVFRGPSLIWSAAEATWLGRYYCGRALLSALLRKPLPLNEAGLIEILNSANRHPFFAIDTPRVGLIHAAERFVAMNGMSATLRTTLEATYRKLKARSSYKQDRDLAKRVLVLLGGTVHKPAMPIVKGDAWTDAALLAIEAMEQDTRAAWIALLEHCGTAKSSKPSARWLKQGASLIARVGEEPCAACVREWLGLIGAPGSKRPDGHAPDPTLLNLDNTTVLKGLVWCASQLESPDVLDAVSAAGEASFKKIANFGPRSVKLGNACLWFLSTAKGDRAVAALVRIRSRARHPSIRKQIDTSLGRQATSRGQTPEDLIELAVPTFELALPGVLRRSVGGFEAMLSIDGSTTVSVQWKAASGRVTRTTPKAARESDSEAVRALSRMQREIERTLPGQRDRLERLFLSNRSWSLGDWRARFADHPLLHHMISRLIWEFARSDGRRDQGVFREGAIVGVDDQRLGELGPDVRVALWHPITSPADRVAAWREHLSRHGIRQPFKQAHREVYLLTDAERTTEVYSNRFAAHILRQHQMAELCRARAWVYRLAGTGFDGGGGAPTLTIPAANLMAEFVVSPIEDAEPGSGISRYVATDQICFSRGDTRGRIPLREVPPIIFSEVLRDVDLFVGVCSVGNNPEWQDGGPPGQFGQYWHSYAWGELGESGKTRRDVLERILPRLKIAGVCSLSEKFLVVLGKLRTYKIHLGSGNILMEPDDQYLCIVPGGRSESADVYLPFEGDRVLSIILSKAFMLADDDTIKDTSITRQIARRV